MGFWDTSTGQATGKAELANLDLEFEPIPNKTKVAAIVRSVKKTQYEDNMPYYKVTWKIYSHNYRGRILFQNLYINHDDPKKRDRAKNMLARLFVLNDSSPPMHEPTNMDLMSLSNLRAELLVMKFERENGTEANWIASVNEASKVEYDEGAQAFIERGSDSDYANEQNNMNQGNKFDVDDDIPF